jgi:hypothetical protein
VSSQQARHPIELLVGAYGGAILFLVNPTISHRRFDNPHDAVNGTYGRQGKAVAVTLSAALLLRRFDLDQHAASNSVL